MRLLEDAAANQMRVHNELDKGVPDDGISWRMRSLKPGFKYDLEAGEVLDEKGKPHEFNGIWLCSGQLLLCETCHEDAT